MSYPTISVNELHQKCASGEQVRVIDVRTPKEYQAVHATIAMNFPLESLDPKKVETAVGAGPIYVVCRSGTRSKMACDKLAAAGLKVINVDGGTLAWQQAGYPVQTGRKALPIDRQMRIIAGSLVILGVALIPVHIGFVGLSAFVGAGLVFAGITDICPMMMMLARMPWNQVSEGASCSAAPNN